ncbi:MAG: hypothetical protein MUF28_04880 [Ignavibacterium sp.]|jgi:hypothetical protein|nr:hypothetical protein [Ignavibacterium sp.]
MKTLILLCFPLLLFAQQNMIQPFLPDVFSRFPNVRDVAISSDGDEVYFSVQSYADEVSLIGCLKRVNDKWLEPEIVTFSGKYFDIEPFLSANGLKLFFASNRPLKESESEPKDFDIWYVERRDIRSDWSNPINVGAPINSGSHEFYPSIANNNNFYFTCNERSTKGKDDIFVSYWKDGNYFEPVSMSDSINSDGYEFNAFVAPDESYIIFTAYQRKDGFGSGDLYISYKISDSAWTKSKNLGQEINSDKMDYCPFVDANNNLYFTSKRTSINDPVKPLNSMNDFFNELKKYDNGLSRIYRIKFQ